MKTIIATQNEDGTYKVVITNKTTRRKLLGLGKEEEIIEGTMEMDRAVIEITPLVPADEAPRISRIVV